MKEISNSDFNSIIRLLRTGIALIDDSTMQRREMRRKSKLLLRKLERKE